MSVFGSKVGCECHSVLTLTFKVGEQLELIKQNQDVVVGLTAVSDPDAFR